MTRFRFFLGIQDEKSSQTGEDDPNIKFPISAPPSEIEVTLGWMPHQAHECVDDRGQGKDQPADFEIGHQLGGNQRAHLGAFVVNGLRQEQQITTGKGFSNFFEGSKAVRFYAWIAA